MTTIVNEIAPEILIIQALFSPEFCREIIDWVNHLSLNPAGIQVRQIDSTVRSNDLLYLGEEESELQALNELIMEKIKLVQAFLHQHYGIYFAHAEPCSILRYQEGQFYKRHVDNLLFSSRLEEAARQVPIRDVSVVGYLNEAFEGGETYFDRQQVKITPRTGSVLVFPAYWTHPHASLPVRRGTKYAFTTWLFH
ncbi:MAG: prolyl hydroxylase family protein [Prochlorotrichaceae cyanobacterium]|jgi:predicted 2-oxoglutarate/Fe(II)-dependent dioxygenase YbiX